MNDGKKSRRRRSSSLIYQEPPESIEHMSDQSALPNVNADWVNAKGEHTSDHGLSGKDTESDTKLRGWNAIFILLVHIFVHAADTDQSYRSLGYPRNMHNRPQASLRRHPRSLSRNIMDTCQHRLYVQLVFDVPLRPRRSIRVQRWGLRQFEHVGADRQRGSVHSGEEVPPECSDSSLPSQHALHTL